MRTRLIKVGAYATLVILFGLVVLAIFLMRAPTLLTAAFTAFVIAFATFIFSILPDLFD